MHNETQMSPYYYQCYNNSFFLFRGSVLLCLCTLPPFPLGLNHFHLFLFLGGVPSLILEPTHICSSLYTLQAKHIPTHHKLTYTLQYYGWPLPYLCCIILFTIISEDRVLPLSMRRYIPLFFGTCKQH